jgi:hypothetical protein
MAAASLFRVIQNWLVQPIASRAQVILHWQGRIWIVHRFVSLRVPRRNHLRREFSDWRLRFTDEFALADLSQ